MLLFKNTLASVLLSLMPLLILSELPTSPLPRIHVEQSTGHFVDQYGRVRMFRGINSVLKSPPWYESGLVDTIQFVKDLKDLGWNVVRLGNMWSGWQPEDSKSYNDTYGEIVKGIMDNLESAGVYTLLDMHQDVLWEEPTSQGSHNGYWGVPPWIKTKLNHSSAQPYPYPLEHYPSGIMWGCGYFTDRITKGFQDYYDNVQGALDDNINFYATIAEKFKGRGGLLGYEVINEPFTGDVFADTQRILPGIAGQEYFVKYYDEVQKAVRQSDQDTMLFWEPVTWAYYAPFSSSSNELFKFAVKELFTADVLTQIVGLVCGGTDSDFNHVLNILNTKLQQVLKRQEPTHDGTLLKLVTDLSESKSTKEMMKEIAKRIDMMDFEPEKNMKSDNPPVWGPGLTVPPGGSQYANRSVMSWHYYCPIASKGPGNKDPFTEFQKLLCDTILAPLVFKTADKRSKEVGGGRMLTEFGSSWPDIRYPDSKDTVDMNAIMDQADEHISSWIYWDSNVLWCDAGSYNCNSERKLDPNIAKALARPYPQATIGTPTKISYDVKTKRFEYQYSIEGTNYKVATENGDVYTEIVVPAIQYPNQSFEIDISPQGIFRWQVSANLPSVIELVPNDQALKVPNPLSIKVVITSTEEN